MSQPETQITEDPLLTQIYQLVHQYNSNQLEKLNFPMRLIAEHHNYICCCRNCMIESSDVDEYRMSKQKNAK